MFVCVCVQKMLCSLLDRPFFLSPTRYSSWDSGLQHVYTPCCIHGSTALVGHSVLFISVQRSQTHHTTLNERSACRRGRYLHNTQHTQQKTSIALARFEPATPASEQPQTHALDRVATGIGLCRVYCQLTALLVLLLRHVSTANRSHLQGATGFEEMNSCQT